MAATLWIITTVLGAVLAVVWVGQSMWHHRIGVDLIALAALIGTLLIGEYVAGALITARLPSESEDEMGKLEVGSFIGCTLTSVRGV